MPDATVACALPGALDLAAGPARGADLPLLLRARGLTFQAEGLKLIDGIDLDLFGNGRSLVIGPNGAGKSLLLRLLHGLIRPGAGSLAWNGRPLDPATRRRQAMVFQRPVLLRRSVAANLRYALKVQGLARADLSRQVEHWLARAGLSALADRPARLLSGGEQQRLAVVRALCGAPEVLFLDEPTASLDPASMLTIERLIDEAHQQGTKIVMVTHDLGQARRLADEVLFLYRGRLEEQAPAERFFRDPQSDKARAFLEGRIVL